MNKTDKNDKCPYLYEVHILVGKGQGDINIISKICRLPDDAKWYQRGIKWEEAAVLWEWARGGGHKSVWFNTWLGRASGRQHLR